MASDSWREIQIDVKAGNRLSGDCIGVYFKGGLYWSVWMPDRILYFDMSSEEFQSIPLPAPHDVEQARPRNKKTHAAWNNSLALLISGGVLLSIEMVMDDYQGGVKAPWTKHLSILGPLENYLYQPIMFWKSDELLMRKKNEGIVSYNLGTQKFRNLLNGVSSYFCDAYLYTKSLVSVKGRN